MGSLPLHGRGMERGRQRRAPDPRGWDVEMLRKTADRRELGLEERVWEL